jgi:alanyl-tRNA synthetase
MQQYKPLFSDPDHRGTISNSQHCLRLGDLDEIGDGTHFLDFTMLGLFSFRRMSVGEAIDYWLEFMDRIGLFPHYVTIHPDRMDEWEPLYRGRVPVRPDDECIWSDGSISGYCTEFYRDGVEIGNIVNPLGTCIDAGFGLERLDMLLNGSTPTDTVSVLVSAVEAIIGSGYEPGPTKQGYVLRKLLRRLWQEGGGIDHPYFRGEVDRQSRMRARYDRLLPKHGDKPREWWFDTHGIDVADMVSVE